MTDLAADAGGNDEKQRPRARDLNDLIRYTMWAVFTVTDRDFARDEAATELTDLLDQANGKGIVTRGCYDLQGMRADADYMLWWVAPTSDELQEMYVNFRRTKLGRASEPVWSAMALHRPAEFNIIKHVVLPTLGVIVVAIPIYYLFKPGQAAPYDGFPWAGVGLIVVSVLYAIWLVRRDPGLGDRVGSIIADE